MRSSTESHSLPKSHNWRPQPGLSHPHHFLTHLAKDSAITSRVQVFILLWQSSFSHSWHSPNTFQQCLCGRVILTMPLWTCDFESCHGPAVRTLGDCVLCNRHLCSNHLKPEFHTCPRWEVSLFPHSAHLLANSSIVRTRTLTILQPGMLKGVSSQS